MNEDRKKTKPHVMKKVFINHEEGDPDEWICLCGNTSFADGFAACDSTGKEMEPTIESDWNGLFVCVRCGRIIENSTREVVGQRPTPDAVRDLKQTTNLYKQNT